MMLTALLSVALASASLVNAAAVPNNACSALGKGATDTYTSQTSGSTPGFNLWALKVSDYDNFALVTPDITSVGSQLYSVAVVSVSLQFLVTCHA
jgi:hypothetical protein